MMMSTCPPPPAAASSHDDDSASKEEGPLPTVQQVLQCQFASWYPIFSNLPINDNDTSSNGNKRSNVTLKSAVIPLPDNFREYLSADGVQLPVGAKVSSYMLNNNNNGDGDDDSSKWSSDSSDDDNDNDPDTPQFNFDDLNTAIETAIASLNGKVVPKLNWSSPKDAVWVNSGTMACESAGDVYLLIKASDFCSYDAQHALLTNNVIGIEPEETDTTTTGTTAATWPLQLVLRKWCNLYPQQEFRCFCFKGCLVAISQRQDTQHYPHTVRDQYLYRSLITEFFDDVVQPNYGATTTTTADIVSSTVTATTGSGSNSFVFDVYIDKKERVWLLDFNVWGRQTDTLMYSWPELTELANTMMNEQQDDGDDDVLQQPDIRVVETARQVRQDPLSSYRAPIDTVHVASMTGGDKAKFDEFMTMCERPTVLEQEEDGDARD